MKILGFILVLGMLLFNVVCRQNAAVVNELKEASKIVNDSERLQKYDQILENNGIKAKSLNVNEKLAGEIRSKWMVSTDTNPINDSKIILFSLIADEGISAFGKPVCLIIRYKNKKTEVFVGWGDYLGDEAYVTMRIGSEKAETFLWSVSTDKTSTFYTRNCIDFVKRIKEVDKVVFQCTPYNESPITAVFDVRSLSETAEEFMNDLGWW